MTIQKPRKPLSREERANWWEAFKIAFEVALGRDSDALNRSYPAIVRVAGEAADAALAAYRQRVKRE